MRYVKAIVPIGLGKQSGILCVVQLLEQRIVALHTDWFSIKTSNNPKMTILEFKVLAWKFIPNEAKI